MRGYQDLADAGAGEVDADCQPGAGVGQRLDQDLDGRRIGPLTPCTLQVLGGSMWVSLDVDGRLAPPIRRVVTHLAPTAGAPLGRAVHVPVDHALLPFAEPGRVGGVGEDLVRRPVDLGAVTIGAMSAALLHEQGVAVQV